MTAAELNVEIRELQARRDRVAELATALGESQLQQHGLRRDLLVELRQGRQIPPEEIPAHVLADSRWQILEERRMGLEQLHARRVAEAEAQQLRIELALRAWEQHAPASYLAVIAALLAGPQCDILGWDHPDLQQLMGKYVQAARALLASAEQHETSAPPPAAEAVPHA